MIFSDAAVSCLIPTFLDIDKTSLFAFIILGPKLFLLKRGKGYSLQP